MPPIKVSNSFVKAQFSSLASTVADFLITHLLTEVFGLWYLLSSALGTIIGGLLNFSLGRYWTFKAFDQDKVAQIQRYIVIWIGSLLLNLSGVFLLTEVLKFHYLLSKTIVSITVGVFFNFYFQKSFVFKN